MADLYMDVPNNTIGIEVGETNPNASIYDLVKIIMKELAIVVVE